MKAYAEMTKAELRAEREQVLARYEELKARGQNLNMARGKPSKAQLDMNGPMMDILRSDSDYMCDGIDVRNYGNLEGLPACRRLFAELLDCQPALHRRQRLSADEVRHHRQGLYPRPAAQPQALGEAGPGQVALPRPRL